APVDLVSVPRHFWKRPSSPRSWAKGGAAKRGSFIMASPNTGQKNQSGFGQAANENRGKPQDSGSSLTDKARDAATAVADKAKDLASSAAHTVSDTASNLGHKASDAASNLGHKVSDTASNLGHKADDAVGSVGTGMKNL